MNKIYFPAIAILFVVSMLFGSASAQRGGQFEIEQSVIASGGGAGAGGTFGLEGTAGQSAAGTRMNNAPFTQIGGFQTSQQFSAVVLVAVSGRVTANDGTGIGNALVELTGSGGSRQVFTNKSGFFLFADVPTGDTYIFSVFARHYDFSQPTLVRTIAAETNDINFVADIQTPLSVFR